MSDNLLAEATREYEKAYKLGKKENLPILVLDDILEEKGIVSPNKVNLGLIHISIDQIVGTKTVGRGSSFSRSFYPLIKGSSEFVSKWVNLYKAHLNEGIRDPIMVYEYMHEYYVEEGNKRVSILKYFDAVSIPAYVTRIIPPWSEDKDVRIYYEFMEFYNLSQVHDIWFTQIGSFAKLQQLLGKRPDEKWTKEDRETFNKLYIRFKMEYTALGGKKLSATVGDVFLFFISLYDYHTLKDMSFAELNEKMHKTWSEFKFLNPETSLELQMEPKVSEETGKNLFSLLLPSSNNKLNVAFIHEKSKETSAWTYSHELGRMHLEETFADEIRTTSYEGTTEENADAVLEEAISAGNNLIFTTAPTLYKASLKAALTHPNVKILNCSLNNTQKNMRTYYARMYEAKFLMGAIAGAMSKSGNIGYVADYPIFGMTANINAFALGAKMVNSRAQVILEWTTIKDHDIYETFAQNNVGVISGLDMLVPGTSSRRFGLYRYNSEKHTISNLAMPVWHWGKFYEKLIRNIMSGSFKSDGTNGKTKSLNYWWGMSAEIIDVICSQHLPIGTSRLIELLKDNICNHNFNPFDGILYSQDGMVQDSAGKIMSPEEIVKMDWLAENVVGFIPKTEDLTERAKPLVEKQGVITN